MVDDILIVRDLSKTVSTLNGDLTLLRDINFKVKVGHSLAIIGSSGSGKSTLLALLAGLDRPTSGDIVLNGRTLNQLSEDECALLRSQQVGFIFQSFQLLETLTALENVMLPLELIGASSIHIEAERILTQVGLAHRMDHYPKQLSGGEQQRVAIARAFVTHPKVLFADEPTGNLDQKTGQQIIDLLFELNERLGTTLILVTHEQRLADRCQSRLRIEAGQIAAEEA